MSDPAHPLPYVLYRQDESVADYLNQLFEDAINKHVSDIHIEPQAKQCRIRFRRDGLLYETAVISTHLASCLIMRLKVLAGLNTAEKRLPQDGHLHLNNHHNIDIRLNTCPTLYGEKVALRLLDTRSLTLGIDALGMTIDQQALFIRFLSQPQGLILVTGPTGSGKTITLYAGLQYLNDSTRQIITIEDPIEIELPGINQIAVHPRIGFDFAAALRTLLRQDPDILMIGEIRDHETASIAIQAAQTGHLVLATLHANNAQDSVTRLQSLGINQADIHSTLSLVIAQRLIRILNHHGDAGRTGIFECLCASTLIGHSLRESGLQKIEAGLTTQDEISRVLGS